MPHNDRKKWLYLGAAFIALFSHCALFFTMDANEELKPDASYYAKIARQLSNTGDIFSYIDPSSPWGDVPSMARPPGWPAALSAILALFHPRQLDSAVRTITLGVNMLNGVLIGLLTVSLWSSRPMALAAAVTYWCFPSGLYLSWLGMSEPFFVCLLIIGCILFVRRGRVSAAAVWGLLPLVRPQFLLFMIAFIVSAIFLSRHRLETIKKMKHGTLALLLFLLPSSLWIVRNYFVSGVFPLFSSLRGETFYGSNNEVVANDLDTWGYWVFPDELPNETAKRTLAKQMSEAELDKYYFDKGMAFLASHPLAISRLLLGKIVRSTVPIPWHPSLLDLGAAGFRVMLYISVALYFVRRSARRLPVSYQLFLLSCLLVHAVTTVVFYGSPRFSFLIEPLFIPLAIAGWTSILRNRSSRSDI